MDGQSKIGPICAWPLKISPAVIVLVLISLIGYDENSERV